MLALYARLPVKSKNPFPYAYKIKLEIFLHTSNSAFSPVVADKVRC
nr:MAG TPA: hypothetical protein [Caudoviricetes sp.]